MIPASIDPGSAWCGFTVGPPTSTRPTTDPTSIAFATSIEVGELIDRKGGPQTITKQYTDRKTGELKTYSYVKDKERRVTAADEAAAIDKLGELLVLHRVTHLVIERVEHVYTGEGETPRETAMRARAQATNLLRAGRIESGVAERARGLGIEVAYVTRNEWAFRVCQKRRSGDPDVLAALRSLLPPADLDKLCYRDRKDQSRVKPDRRDAAGALLWYLLPPLEKKPTKPRRPRGEPRPAEPFDPARYAAKKKLLERREALKALPKLAPGTGYCVRCNGPRKGHVRGLPCPPRTTDPGSPTTLAPSAP